MPVDMVDPILRVVFDRENGQRLPERAVREALHDPAQGEIVVRDACLGRTPSGTRSVRMIAGQNDQHEVGHRVLRFPDAQMLEDHVRLHDVRNGQRPAWIFANQNAVERRNVGPRVVAPGHEIAEVRRIVGLGIAVLREQGRPHTCAVPLRRGCVFTEDTDRLALCLRSLPEKAARRVRERIHPF